MKSADVIIVGGAVYGASAAYHLAADFGGTVLLIEKDQTFRRAPTTLSCGAIRQQFSTAVNRCPPLLQGSLKCRARLTLP
jgi:glycine/D-amino acid oxidase-like deaminating enzyme